MKRLAIILSAAVLAVSCVPENNFSYGSAKVTFSADAFDMGDTRTGIGADGSFIWSANDTVGIYPDAGSQIYFEMTDGAGTSTAEFDSGWLLKAGHEYVSYYPFIGDIYLDRKAVPVSYEGQVQTGKANADLSGYDYMYSDPVSGDSGKLKFQYHHLGCILRCKADLPAGRYASLTLDAGEDLFVSEGTFDLSSDTPAIIPSAYSSTLSISLADFNLTAPASVSVYLMTAPSNMTGRSLRATFCDAGGNVLHCFNCSVKSAFEAGCGYDIAESASSKSVLKIRHSLKYFVVPYVPGATSVLWGDGLEAEYGKGLRYNYSKQGEYEVSISAPSSKASTFEFSNINGIRKIDLSQF